MEESRRPRAVFMAFGTKGDVFPIAAIATAFACDQQWYHVLFITHLAHQSLGMHLEAKNITYIPVSTPPVLAVHQDGNISDSDQVSFSLHKKIIQQEHRKECLSAIERVFGDCPSIEGDFIVINFFSLVYSLLLVPGNASYVLRMKQMLHAFWYTCIFCCNLSTM
ncbi:hypothetical protein COCNU_11G010330 [Cocos nucifera]|uniref:UDP-Glycosyltransferase superfamily protein n=1 Tax=Cocos nucifera TaxID=13894 RepID=A0A8K0N992_COCNU|nr:hypothetical protein COCNU_11G010330 [Cocos nucifera]